MAAVRASGSALTELLFQIDPFDPLAIGGAVALLALVAFGAGLVPAIRAGRVTPMRALRYE